MFAGRVRSSDSSVGAWAEARSTGASVWQPWRCNRLLDTSSTPCVSPLVPARPEWWSMNKESSLEALSLSGWGRGEQSKVLITRGFSHERQSTLIGPEVLWREMGQNGCQGEHVHSVQNLSVDNEMWITLNIINKLMGFLLFNGQVIFHYTHTHTHTPHYRHFKKNHLRQHG